MFIAAAIGAWLLTGVIAVLILRHRGHDTFSWGLLFFVLGPLAIPIAVSADRHRPEVDDPRPQRGEFDVLVAHDGTADATSAVTSALEMLNGNVTSVTLAAVVDVEAASTVRGRDTTVHSTEVLEAAAERLHLACGPANTVVLYGDAPRALAEFASGHGYELIVVAGADNRGAARRRVARRLAAMTSVPVLVAPVRS